LSMGESGGASGPGPPGVEVYHGGLYSLWGRRYRVVTCRVPLGAGRDALVVRLEEVAGSDRLHVAVAGTGEEMERLERLVAVDPEQALEQAARSRGLVAAEGSVWSLASLGFLEANCGRRLVVQYKPGRAILVADIDAYRELLNALRPICGGYHMHRVAERVLEEAADLASCGDDARGIVYLIDHRLGE